MKTGFSEETLLHLGNQDPAFVRKMLQMYHSYGPECIHLLGQALQDQNTEAFRKVAHRLKSSSQLLCLEPLYQTMQEFEQVTLSKQNLQVLQEKMKILKELMQAVVLQIENSPWYEQ
jgi:HPt (histidine-containing phosphotransfer) domain-containing protein